MEVGRDDRRMGDPLRQAFQEVKRRANDSRRPLFRRQSRPIAANAVPTAAPFSHEWAGRPGWGHVALCSRRPCSPIAKHPIPQGVFTCSNGCFYL